MDTQLLLGHRPGTRSPSSPKRLGLHRQGLQADAHPPRRWVRGEHYRYKFSRPGGLHAAEGKWWIRKRLGPYFPPLSLRDLRDYFRSREWPHPEPR